MRKSSNYNHPEHVICCAARHSGWFLGLAFCT